MEQDSTMVRINDCPCLFWRGCMWRTAIALVIGRNIQTDISSVPMALLQHYWDGFASHGWPLFQQLVHNIFPNLHHSCISPLRHSFSRSTDPVKAIFIQDYLAL